MCKFMLAVCTTFLLLLPNIVSGQTQNSTGTTIQSPEEIAKVIGGQKTGTLDLRGSKMEVKIEEKNAVYQFREGLSRVVLLKLPDYTEPYVLRIFSSGSGFMTLRAFAPIAVVLDSEFKKLDNNKVDFAMRTGNKRKVFSTEISLDDTWRNAKYLFFYTNGSAIGNEAARDVGGTTTVNSGNYTVTGVPVLDVVFRNSATGHLKFEVRKK